MRNIREFPAGQANRRVASGSLAARFSVGAGAALLALACLGPVFAESGPAEAAHARVDYMIIVTGGELLAGAYADGHTQFVTRTLHPLELHCVGSMIVDDVPADLQEALRYASAKAPLLIVTGGLGPTDNDITRQTLAAFTGIPLAEHPEVIRQMEKRFNTPREQLRANLRRQACVPTRGTYLKNSGGTAVGLVFERDHSVIVALPGPPRELQPMVREELVPYLSRRFGTHPPGCSLTVRFVGIGQSAIDQTMKERGVLVPQDATLSSQFEGGRVDFTFSFPHDTAEDRARLEKLKQGILQHLGDYVYAVDAATSLEACVVQMLQQRGMKVVLAEVGSGGSLAAGLDGEAGAERVVAGAYVAPTDEGLRRGVLVPQEAWDECASSEDRARMLATAAAETTGSHWAIAVGELHVNARGDREVAVVFRAPDGGLAIQRQGLRATTQPARAGLVTQLLDQLRRRLR